MRWITNPGRGVAVAALGLLMVAGSLSPRIAVADDAWLARIEDMVSRVEALVHQMDEEHTVVGADMPARLEGLDRRLDSLERASGLPEGHLHLYRGDNETRRLESWTQAAANLGQRAAKVKRAHDRALLERVRGRRAADPASSAPSGVDLRGGRVHAKETTSRGTSNGEGPTTALWVQAYNPMTNRTVVAVTRFEVARDLAHEVSIEFQHEAGTIDTTVSNLADWPLTQLVREAKLLPHVNCTWADRDKEREFPPRGPVSMIAGVGPERVEIKGAFKKLADGDGAFLLRNDAEVLITVWPACAYHGVIRTALEVTPRTWPWGLLGDVAYSVPSEPLDLIAKLMDAFRLAALLAPEQKVTGSDSSADGSPAASAPNSGSSRPAGAVDPGQREASDPAK